MRIFIDSADTEVIKSCFSTGLVDGLTTNPSLIRKSGKKHEDVYQELKEIGIPDISMEVIGDRSNMISEGKRLHKKFGKCATIKVPCTKDGLMACAALSDEGIRVNVTLIFDAAQAILAATAGARYVSPFVGRLDDNSIEGLECITSICDIFSVQGVETCQVLSASIRDVKSVSQSFARGASIVTMPPTVFEKMYNHVLTDKGLNIFEEDSKQIPT